MVKFTTLFISIFVIFISPAYADVSVEADQENESYKVTGELLLDETFNGSFESQKTSRNLPGL